MQYWYWTLGIGIVMYLTIVRPITSYAMYRISERWEILLGADQGLGYWIVEAGYLHGDANSFWDYMRIYHAMRIQHYRELLSHIWGNLWFDPRKHTS